MQHENEESLQRQQTCQAALLVAGRQEIGQLGHTMTSHADTSQRTTLYSLCVVEFEAS